MESSTTKLLIFMLFFILHCENACLGADEVICRENEREALLGIKQGIRIEDYTTWLSSWGTQQDHKECCSWEGVVCSNRTGHVVRLDLHFLPFPIFDGEICPALAELHHLNYLDLSSIGFGGIKVPECICSLNKLESLYLSWCNFSSVPYQLESLTNLRYLDFSGNKFGESKIVEFFESFKKLEYLNLTRSRISGDIPYQLWNLKNLRRLDLSHNSLQGTISEVHLSKLHNLTHLYLSFNSLALNLTPDWVPPFQLEEIRLARCSMGPRFPTWLQTQTKFSYLDLSSNGISSQVPNWLWDQSRGISYLDLSDNQLSGSVPLSSNSIVYLNISSNNLSGHAPLFYPNSYVLHLSGNLFSGSIQSLCGVMYKNLQILDLSKNQLSGDIPECWQHMPYLGVLNLADNKFNGHLPRGLSSLNFLQSLIFRNNNLTGELPTLSSNSNHLELIDVGGNKLTGNVPRWLGELRGVSVLSLRQNNFYGSIPNEICHLSEIKILDLSHNSLSGTIPECFDKFTSLLLPTWTRPSQSAYTGIYSLNDSTRYNYDNDAMVRWKKLESEYKNTLGLLKLIDLSSNKLVGNIPPKISRLAALGSLNLSRNYLTGNIIRDIDAMTMLEILDLSTNNLSGEIPTNLAKLHFLAVLDLSDNSLSGKIPESTQLQSFDASTYAGNMALCGAPLSNCPGDSATRTSANQGNQRENINEGGSNMINSLFEEYFISALLGFIVGFWGIIGPISFKRAWRNAYYGYWSKIGDRLYVTVTICKTRFS